MNFNQDLNNYSGQCIISDLELNMILESKLYLKINDIYYITYKNYVINFKIKNNIAEIIKIRRKPNKNYFLPEFTNNMTFAQRVAICKEQFNLVKNFELDEQQFMIYKNAKIDKFK